MTEPKCRKRQEALGLAYPKSSCEKCGSILRAGWRCAEEALNTREPDPTHEYLASKNKAELIDMLMEEFAHRHTLHGRWDALTAENDQMSGLLDDRCAELTALRAETAFRPTHRHVKRGTEYQVIAEARVQTDKPLTDYDPVVIYKAEDGMFWARHPSEFNDGRFIALPPSPADQGTGGGGEQ